MSSSTVVHVAPPADQVVGAVVDHFVATMRELTPRQQMQQALGLQRVLQDEAHEPPSALSRATMAACLEQARLMLRQEA